MPSHSALLYVLLPNFINELQISSYQFSYTFAKSIPSSISLDLNTLNSLKRLFFAGYFSIFLIKKGVIFSNTPEIPRKKTENHNYCIKLILLTYQNRDFNPYFSMKKGLITSIKPMLSRWWPIRDSNPWMHAWKACELSHFSNRPCVLALTIGLEPTTDRLTADCSTIELSQHLSTLNKYIKCK